MLHLYLVFHSVGLLQRHLIGRLSSGVSGSLACCQSLPLHGRFQQRKELRLFSLVNSSPFLKNPRIAIALSVTLFMFIGYSAVYTYIAPLLTNFISEQKISVVLFIIGVASLIGSKLGGFSVDRFGVGHTLIIGMMIQALALALLSAVTESVIIITLAVTWVGAASVALAVIIAFFFFSRARSFSKQTV
ncbi:hypothetical protein P9H20_08745 [Lederbergia lenta]|uniref:Chloramphenicol resistance protein n=1 Tax=Lederbergia lenta TaxID=1467 RepID=A0A2X4WMV2_LEDLE|nr:hypothetical protein [Lederbergia lenta]MEC2324400.1 hypothetical protein [Lederbergia lenta]SQI60042.1 chloramphenicol resistance protein [Lederbergia lenta]